MFLPIYLTFLAILSLITFALYAMDKRRAQKHAWRIPEKVLLCFSFFGGAAGGLFGMYFLRHKTKHWYFLAINGLGLIWQGAVALLLFSWL